MININLDCGRMVYVSSFHCSSTYAGLWAGKPTGSFNRWLIDNAVEKAGYLWGRRKTYMITPKLVNTHTESPELPPLLWYIWLTCNKPINEEYFGSELVVIFFRDYVIDKNVGDIFKAHLLSVPWMEEAEDFQP